MKITKINPEKIADFVLLFTAKMEKHDIELYDMELKAKSFKFRARRTFNKPCLGGGMKYGQPIQRYSGKLKMARHLHWEEWKLINDSINDILDILDAHGSFKSWFDGENRWIRQNGIVKWYDGESVFQELRAI